MIVRKKSSPSIGRVVSLYWAAESVRFVVGVILIYKIFHTLSVGEYARYSIIQSLATFLALLFSFNVDSSMQKVFSKSRLAAYSNIFYVFFVTVLVALGSAVVLFLVYIFPGLQNYVTGDSNIYFDVVVLYAISIAVNGCVQSYSNASGRNYLYMFTVLMQPVSFLLLIFYFGISSLNKLIVYSTISYLLPVLVLVAAPCSVGVKNFRLNRFIKVMKYVIFYSLPSFPALGSKQLLDYLARISILHISGEIGVAAIALVNTIFSVFRAAERAFFRAVTPFVLKGNNVDYNLSVVSNLLWLKVSGVLIFILLSPFWFPFLLELFPNKSPEVFSQVLLVGMSLVYILSLLKNYYMTLCKKNIVHMKKFFYVATILNLSGCFYVAIFGVSDRGYLAILFGVLLVNVLYLRRSYSVVPGGRTLTDC